MRSWLRLKVWHAVPSVVAAAALGAVTNLATSEPSVALVVGLVALVGTQVGFAVWQGRQELADARVARGEVLGPLRPKRPVKATELDWLSAGFSPTRLWGRTTERDALVAWCTAGKGEPLRILGGPAGVGKSRLALAVAEELPEPWVTGWLLGCADLVARVRACGEPTLVIVDDADTVPDLVELINLVESWPATMRVLLLARDAHGLRATLRKRVHSTVRPVLAADPVVLAPVGGGGDRTRWYADAVTDYARALGVPPPQVGQLPVGDDDDTMLLLHARALLAVLNRPGARTLAMQDVAAHLFDIESGHWSTDAPEGATEDARTEVVVALTLIPAPTTTDAAAALRGLPRFADATAERLTALVEWAWQRYPPGPDHRLNVRPHLVAEWLLLTRLDAHPDLLTVLTPDTRPVVVTILARACQTFPGTITYLVHVLQADTAQLATLLEIAYTTLPTYPAVDQALAELVATIPANQAEPFLTRQPPDAFPRLRCALTALTVAHYRVLVQTDRDAYLPDLAGALDSLHYWLGEVGRRTEALAVAEEAVTICRELVRIDRDAHLPNLAHALNNLGIWFGEVGRPVEGLAVAEEAVAICRELVQIDRDAHLPNFARALTSLGILFGEVGRPAEALAVAEEAVAICRELVRIDRDAHLPNFARALTSLGGRLGEVGRRPEALAVAEEVVTILRELVQIDRGAHLPNLANALTNLGNRLGEVGRPIEGLAAAEEAVTLCRDLVQINRDARLPGLATALTNLGNRLGEVGRPIEGLAVAEEAVTAYRELVQINRAAHLPALANALNNLGLRLGEVGRPTEALAAAEEAVTLCRELVQTDRDAHLPSLAKALHNLGNRFSGVGRPVEALAVAEEAVTLYRELVQINRDAQFPNLARALTNLGIWLGMAQRREEELVVRREAVETWKACADRYPDLYGRAYREAGRRLSHLLEASGDPTGAFQARLDVTGPIHPEH